MLEAINIKKYESIYDFIDKLPTHSKGSVNILSFYRAVYEADNKDVNHDVMYRDSSKALDRMPYQRMLMKIKVL